MKHVPIYIILVLLLLVVTCSDNKTSCIDRTKAVVEYDTTIIHHTIRDTITSFDTIVKNTRDTIVDSVKYSLNEYHYKVNDSLITGEIVVEAPFNPILRYELTANSFHTTEYTKETITNLRGFLYGGQITIDPLLTNLQGTLAYQNKRGSMYSLGLGFDFTNKNRLISVGYLKKF